MMMSRARKWPMFKLTIITFLCGVGHILSSVVLGIIGIILGIAVMKLAAFEAWRGNLAAWALIGFGVAYFIWGLHQAWRNKPHQHLHFHADSTMHAHSHPHDTEHAHLHGEERANITPWILFTIFVLGPCEPLIPILMYPAAKQSLAGLFWVSVIFGSVTITTMLTIVLIASRGINLIPLGRLERYSHALAGAAIFLCGLAIQFLGL
jgi:ABC-type nickel/cobalt efflux system permease component RcnA